jgi:LysM repeat protein
LAANGLTLTSVIHPGQRLVIPAPAASAPSGGRDYVVQPGDYLFGIARQQGVTVSGLLAANGLTLTSVILPGQRLVIPAPAASASAGTGRYTVRPGDSLFGIARRLGVSSRSLLAANRLTLTSVIHPGQRLVIPARAASPSDGSGASPPPASAQGVERVIRDVWPAALEERALAIAWRESRYDARAQGQCCSGLFQIYFDVHKGWLAELGIDSRSDLYDPRTNAEAALALYQRAGGWSPWSLATG